MLEFVESVSDWKTLGLKLGLRYPTLTDIETHRHYKAEDCLKDMLLAWLQQQDDVSSKGLPSRSVLRAALQKMGEANRIVSGYSYRYAPMHNDNMLLSG